jgi:hypothetical protein
MRKQRQPQQEAEGVKLEEDGISWLWCLIYVFRCAVLYTFGRKDADQDRWVEACKDGCIRRIRQKSKKRRMTTT